jgi:hypothetical protein
MKNLIRKAKKVNFRRGDPGRTRIWRYLDFSRFVALIETRKLHFSPVTAFEDINDGIFNCLTNDDNYDIQSNGRIVSIAAPAPGSKNAQNAYRTKEFIRSFHKLLVDATGVSCWRLDDHESHAMWRIFIRTDEGLAIESTIDKLIGSISADEYHLMIGIVRYIDYAKHKIPIADLKNAFFYKNKYFEHEKELRLICYRTDGLSADPIAMPNYRPLPASGLDLPVDTSNLMNAIYISPYAPKWFSHLVEQMVQRYRLAIPVYPSNIQLRRPEQSN